ncbi:hypothetical protein, partial [Streptomyces sp. b94]
MRTYEGPATVLVDGMEYEVEATLELRTEQVPVPGGGKLRGLSEWRGTLHAQDDGAAWGIYEADQPVIRIDGREGLFISTNTQVGSNEIEI